MQNPNLAHIMAGSWLVLFSIRHREKYEVIFAKIESKNSKFKYKVTAMYERSCISADI